MDHVNLYDRNRLDENRLDRNRLDLEQIKADARIGSAISIIYRHGSSFLGAALADTGIGAGQHACFLLIAERPGIRQEELVRILALDKAHVARAISLLEGRGYIERRSYPEDARSKALYLTDAGQNNIPRVAAAIAAWNERLLGGLSPDERATLADLLDRAAAALR